MVEIPNEKRYILKPLFASFDDTTVISCLEGRNSSRAWADDAENPTAAVVQLGGFRKGSGAFSFIAGDASSPCAKELIMAWPSAFEGLGTILVPENEKWSALIKEVLGERYNEEVRFATSKRENNFDKNKLALFAANVPNGYEVKLIDKELFPLAESLTWAIEAVGNFKSFDEFENDNAIGVAALKDGEIVCAASSYSAYSGGIEIEIDTREDHRRKGLARVCGAYLVFEALDRGLYPSWDAATEISLSIAESLGYIFDRKYIAHWISHN